jgi:hypothetical protein
VECAQNICIHKQLRIGNGPVYMRFGGEMNHMGEALFLKQLVNLLFFQQVDWLKAIARLRLKIACVVEIRRVTQAIQVNHLLNGCFPQRAPDEMRSNEPGSTCDQ